MVVAREGGGVRWAELNTEKINKKTKDRKHGLEESELDGGKGVQTSKSGIVVPLDGYTL